MSKSISRLHDPYEDQLAAARYRAERDQARQELDRIKSDRSWHACADAGMLLSEEDRGAIRWVREHGGLDYVRAEWRSRVPYDRYEARRQRLLGHIAECETALGRRNVRIDELGCRVNDLTNENAELRKRAMPEGYEWPHYEDGSPVLFGDTLEQWPDYDGQFVFDHLEIYQSGELALSKTDGLRSVYRSGERVELPAVPASDGKPLREGETVYGVNTGYAYTVTGFNPTTDEDGDPCVMVVCKTESDRRVDVPSNCLTHERPVLDADGAPIREGDTVYGTVEGGPFIVTEVSDKGSVFVDAFPDTGMHGSMLTHTKPEIDSWERVEEDAGCTATKYNERRGTIFTTKQQVARDLVRRCRALAERERGE